MLSFLVPRRDFEVIQRGDTLIQSGRSIERYDPLVRALTSLSPSAVAKLYATVRPLAQARLAEISAPGHSLDPVVRAALDRLAETPVPSSEPALVPKGAGYAFADPALEALSAPQKNLLRMGVSHARAVQAWLGAVSKALPLNPT